MGNIFYCTYLKNELSNSGGNIGSYDSRMKFYLWNKMPIKKVYQYASPILFLGFWIWNLIIYNNTEEMEYVDSEAAFLASTILTALFFM